MADQEETVKPDPASLDMENGPTLQGDPSPTKLDTIPEK